MWVLHEVALAAVARDDAVDDRCEMVGISLDLFYLTGIAQLDPTDEATIEAFDADYEKLVADVNEVVCK